MVRVEGARVAGPSWQRMYNGLGVFSIASVVMAVALNSFTTNSYRDSVDHSRLWAERNAAFGQLSRVATLANGPGNDVFDTRDISGERAKLVKYVDDFERAWTDARAELVGDAELGAHRDMLIRDLDSARDHFLGMVDASNHIFGAMEAGDLQAAGVWMARMDRKLVEASEAFAGLAASVRALQNELFERELAYVGRLETGSYGLVALVLAMVGLLVAHGQQLARLFATAQAEIDRRRAEVALLLSNVDQGLVTVGADGRMAGTRSAAFTQLFGEPVASGRFDDQLEELSPSAAVWFRMGWEAIAEDLLPIELLLDQLPVHAQHGARHIGLRYRPLTEDGRFAGLLVIATDITAEREREQIEAAQQEALALFQRVLDDRLAVIEFVAEADRIVRAVLAGTENDADEKRLVHTLKGNAALFGLRSLSSACHAFEDACAEGVLDVRHRSALDAAWESIRVTAGRLVGDTPGGVEVEHGEITDILRAIAEQRPHADIARLVAALRLEPVRRRFERLAEQARSLGVRLGKGEISVVIDDGGVRSEPTATAPLWAALVHVVRNAVDHGTLPAEDRAGAPAVIRLMARERDGAVFLEVADEGRGVDWERVRARADALGLAPAGSDASDLLFVDGLSTRESVSDVSGRGVGMGAVRAEARRLGGEVRVMSSEGKGTRVMIAIPSNRFMGSPKRSAAPSRSRPPDSGIASA